MEVAPFFVDFHHFLSIFTIFYQFSRFTHFCRDLHFVAIYALFQQFFLAKIAFSATSHVFCMYESRLWWCCCRCYLAQLILSATLSFSDGAYDHCMHLSISVKMIKRNCSSQPFSIHCIGRVALSFPVVVCLSFHNVCKNFELKLSKFWQLE